MLARMQANFRRNSGSNERAWSSGQHRSAPNQRKAWDGALSMSMAAHWCGMGLTCIAHSSDAPQRHQRGWMSDAMSFARAQVPVTNVRILTQGAQDQLLTGSGKYPERQRSMGDIHAMAICQSGTEGQHIAGQIKLVCPEEIAGVLAAIDQEFCRRRAAV